MRKKSEITQKHLSRSASRRLTLFADTLGIIAFVIFIIVYCMLMALYGSGMEISKWRYYFLFGATILSVISVLLKYGLKAYTRDLRGRELVFIAITAAVFLVVSYQKAATVNMELNFRTYVQIACFAFPAFYALNLVNIYPIQTIFKLMQFTTIVAIISYFLEARHPFLSFFNVANWPLIFPFGSNEFTESHNFSEVFLQLFLFFYYYKDVYKDSKFHTPLKIFSIITFIFTILCHKRLAMIFAIVIVIGKHFIDYKKDFKRSPAILLTIIFIALTYLYIHFLQSPDFSYDQVFNLTSGRNWILKRWETTGFLSYGYGSSMLVINKYLEMDLVQILLELNVFALAIFCFGFFQIARKNTYCNLIMIYAFLNILTSSIFPVPLGWLIMLISVSSIASNENSQTTMTDKKYATQKRLRPTNASLMRG